MGSDGKSMNVVAYSKGRDGLYWTFVLVGFYR